jgi:hypothetical protein
MNVSGVVTFTTRQIYPWYPPGRRLGGPQSQAACGNEEEEPNIYCCTESYTEIGTKSADICKHKPGVIKLMIGRTNGHVQVSV